MEVVDNAAALRVLFLVTRGKVTKVSIVRRSPSVVVVGLVK